MEQKKSEWREWLKAIVVAVLLAGGIRYFIFAPIIVDGISMMPTLHNHERMIVNKLAYKIGMPHRFDIIVFHADVGDGRRERPDGSGLPRGDRGRPGDRRRGQDPNDGPEGEKLDDCRD